MQRQNHIKYDILKQYQISIEYTEISKIERQVRQLFHFMIRSEIH